MITKSDRVVIAAATIILTIISIVAIMPFWLMIASSLSSESSIAHNGYQLLPNEMSMDAYKYIFNQWSKIGRAYGITIFVTTIGTMLSLIITSMFAYGLGQKRIRGTKILFVMLVFSMLFNGGIVSTFYIYSNIFHIKDTIWALIVPGYMMSAFNVILVSMFYRTSIPSELYEAAEIDGANQMTVFLRIVIPLAKPILATVGMLTAVMYWNDWTNGLYYIREEKLYSIQQFLNMVQNNLQFLAQNPDIVGGNVSMADLPSTSTRMAIAVVAILPMLIIFPFIQKYFVKGITLGAVKG